MFSTFSGPEKVSVMHYYYSVSSQCNFDFMIDAITVIDAMITSMDTSFEILNY